MDYNTIIFILLICGSNLLCYLMGAKYSSRIKLIRITQSENIDIIDLSPVDDNAMPIKHYPDEAPENLSTEDEFYYDALRRKQVLKYGGDINDL